jgi:PhzF family phenazine biosynthesis protein
VQGTSHPNRDEGEAIKMKVPIYQVDAFASEVFSGNPAAVCMLDSWIDDEKLQSIAAENNLSETAFLVQNDEGFDLRWFTPTTEVPLCGHATLASAFVILVWRKWAGEKIRFRTRMSGELVVARRNDLLEMNFPSKPPRDLTPPAGLTEALGVSPLATLRAEESVLVVLDSEEAVRAVHPDFASLSRVECAGTIVTAGGSRSDFVSRFFAPRLGIPEDPVTGAAHCILTPYWAGELGKQDLHALQISKRGGELFCTYAGSRVKIAGKAILYLEGAIVI